MAYVRLNIEIPFGSILCVRVYLKLISVMYSRFKLSRFNHWLVICVCSLFLFLRP